jgi:recombination DNA repair RAD52 pathway protein
MSANTVTSGMEQFGHTCFTPDEQVFLQEILAKQLGPEWVSQRPGPAGGMYLHDM